MNSGLFKNNLTENLEKIFNCHENESFELDEGLHCTSIPIDQTCFTLSKCVKVSQDDLNKLSVHSNESGHKLEVKAECVEAAENDELVDENFLGKYVVCLKEKLTEIGRKVRQTLI